MTLRHEVFPGQVFGRLTVCHTAHGSNTLVQCRCLCGKLGRHKIKKLACGWTKSCGCLHKEQLITRNKTHSKSKSRAYSCYYAMRARCELPSQVGYARYGAVGIAVCVEWGTFSVFYADMGDPPTSRHTLDRKDGTKGYSKENCRWATYKQQAQNRRLPQVRLRKPTSPKISAQI